MDDANPKISCSDCFSWLLQHFKENPDYDNPKYNTKLGVYSEGCGLENVLMSFGHDDYMYLVHHQILSLCTSALMNSIMITKFNL